jgi:hypothetical protein
MAASRIPEPAGRPRGLPDRAAVKSRDSVEESRRRGAGTPADRARRESHHGLELARIDAIRGHDRPRYRIAEQLFKRRVVVELNHSSLPSQSVAATTALTIAPQGVTSK